MKEEYYYEFYEQGYNLNEIAEMTSRSVSTIRNAIGKYKRNHSRFAFYLSQLSPINVVNEVMRMGDRRSRVMWKRIYGEPWKGWKPLCILTPNWKEGSNYMRQLLESVDKGYIGREDIQIVLIFYSNLKKVYIYE